MPSIILIVFNFPIFLSGIGGVLLFTILLILYIINRKKSKDLSYANHKLKTEISRLEKNESVFNNKSLDEKIALKTKSLLDKIEKYKSDELDRKIALKKAEETNFLKNTFLANMGLEIRTPLNGIIGFSRLLLNEVEYQEKPELIDFAKGIAESSNRLLNLMDNIIDLSRIDTNDYDLKIKAFEINAVISSCIERTRNLALKKKLALNFEQKQAYWVLGDKEAFTKSLELILDNAVTYTDEGNITIVLSKETVKNELRILISDTGIGIDKSYLTNIFKAFRQESAGFSRVQKGAGLGLPLAQKLMRLMKGDLIIESEKSKGTQVSLFLSLDSKVKSNGNRTLSPKNILTKTEASDPNKPFIFIVEDDKMNRLVFEKMLGSYADIQIAIDGDDAFKQLGDVILSNLVFDIILLDINLPAPWDGLLLLKEFKQKWPILHTIPFVAQTAYAMSGDKERFLAAGFDDYISKPIDKKELFTIIDNNIRKFRAQRIKHDDKY